MITDLITNYLYSTDIPGLPASSWNDYTWRHKCHNNWLGNNMYVPVIGASVLCHTMSCPRKVQIKHASVIIQSAAFLIVLFSSYDKCNLDVWYFGWYLSLIISLQFLCICVNWKLKVCRICNFRGMAAFLRL